MSLCVHANRSLFQIAVQRDSALSLVARINVLIALGIVKLLDPSRYDLVARRHLTVVNVRLGDLQAILRFGGNILNKILRKPSPGWSSTQSS